MSSLIFEVIRAKTQRNESEKIRNESDVAVISPEEAVIGSHGKPVRRLKCPRIFTSHALWGSLIQGSHFSPTKSSGLVHEQFWKLKASDKTCADSSH